TGGLEVEDVAADAVECRVVAEDAVRICVSGIVRRTRISSRHLRDVKSREDDTRRRLISTVDVTELQFDWDRSPALLRLGGGVVSRRPRTAKGVSELVVPHTR